jgi:xanthine dehydrogenase accessory factor
VSLRDAGTAWLATGGSAIVVEVVATRGSVPREAGTRMLVCATRCEGTIGGGHLELKAIEQARAMLANGAREPQQAHYPLGPALGQCCGGTVTLRFEGLTAEVLQRWPAGVPRFHLQLYGAGHVGRAIVRALAPLDARIDWIDERDDEFPATLGSEWPAQLHKVCVDAVEAEVRNAEPGAFYLVLTHRHDLDLRITEAILRRGDFGFVGLIGSRTKKQRFVHHFESLGIAADAIERLICPIGLPGIDGKEPEVIAAAVVAQLLQVAQARAGGLG